jgi:mannitol 2-dehydrogenase
VAAWFRYLTGKDDAGRELPLNDPMGEKLVAAARAGGKDPSRLLAMREVFSQAIATAPAFVTEVTRALASFYEKGAEATLTAYSS